MGEVSYDLNHSSGGLMKEIQALIAPPVSEEEKKNKRPRKSGVNNNKTKHEFKNGPGKSNNNEYCDSCKEGGDLLCCDKCPAAFHLTCNDPPLDEDDVPLGDWLCKKCRILEEINYSGHQTVNGSATTNMTMDKVQNCVLQKSQATIEENGHNKESTEEVECQESEPSPVLCQKNGDSCSSKDNNNDDNDSNDISNSEMDQSIPSAKNLLSLLIEAAKIVNPVQFQLPLEYSPSIAFPGSSKKTQPSLQNNNSSSRSKKQPHEIDNGLVPLPVKVCFKCVHSCRKAPLIQCDFCPLLYHADCLDPPLTTLPTTRWMCPNHVEHILEDKMLVSSSLSERIKLWEKSRTRVSEEVVKLNFLRKVHRNDPYYRCNLKEGPKNCIKVPKAIKEMYNNPLPLQSRHHPSIRWEGPEVEDIVAAKYEVKVSKMCQKEQDALTSMISLQSSHNPTIADRFSNVIIPPLADKFENGITVGKSTIEESSIKTEPPEMDTRECLEVKINGGHKVSGQNMGEEDCDTETIRTKSVKNGAPLHNDINLTNGFHFELDNIDLEHITYEDLTKFDDKFIRYLAFQRLQELSSTKLSNHVNSKHVNRVSETLPPLDCAPVVVNKSSQTENGSGGKKMTIGMRARAVLCPIYVKPNNDYHEKLLPNGPIIAMPYRTLTIGVGANNDVQLTRYGHCNYVSPNHACIFYDEDSKRYELLNYSEYGTTVDNVLYSCDFTEKKVHKATDQSKDSPMVASVKQILRKARKRKTEANDEAKKAKNGDEDENSILNGHSRYSSPPRGRNCQKDESHCSASKASSSIDGFPRLQFMASKEKSTWEPCACRTSYSSLMSPNGAGWEGSAVLHHASHIKMGCIQFVFSITNCGTPHSSPSDIPESCSFDGFISRNSFATDLVNCKNSTLS